MTEDEKKKHLSELNIARHQRFRENHKIRSFSVDFVDENEIKYLDDLSKKLKADNKTKKQFLLESICNYLKKKQK